MADPTASCSNSAGYLNLLGLLWGLSEVEVTFGRIEVFTIAETSPVPLPAALPLFVTGLGALGLLGWRKRRKSVAAVPA